MRKSQAIALVVVTAALAVSCNQRRDDRYEDEYYGTGYTGRTTTHIYHHGGYWYSRPYTSSHSYSPSRSSSYSSGSSSSSSYSGSSSRGGFGSSSHFSSGS